MKQLRLKNISDLAEYMLEQASNGFNVDAVLFYDEAAALMREILLYDVDTGYIEIAKSMYAGYTKEYYVTLSDDLVLSIEPAMSDGKYKTSEPDLMIIDGNASHHIVDDVPVEICRELTLCEDSSRDSCNDCCGDCSTCDEDSDEDEFEDKIDDLFDNVDLIYDGKQNVIGFSVDANRLFKFLFT